jgi:hypothetical protein
MLEKVEVITGSGAVLELPIANSPGGYIVENIDGLDPNKAIFSSTIMALMDGEEYQASRGEKRQITVELGYSLSHPSSVRARRTNLYKYFMPKAAVLLRFYMTDFPVVEITARVEDLNAPMFTKDPKATIILIAHKPDFVAEDETIIPGNSTDTPTAQNIVYGGSVESGFLFTFNVDRAISMFTIDHNQPNGTGSQMIFQGSLIAGDVVEINTQEGSKGAWRIRAGVRTSVLASISPGSDWINLFPGSNSFRVFLTGVGIPYTLKYKERFGGL